MCLYVNWRDQVNPSCGWQRIGATPYVDSEDYPYNYIRSNTPDQWTCEYRFEDTAQTGHPTHVDIQVRCKYEELGNDTFEVWVYDGDSWNYVGDMTPTPGMQWQTIDVSAYFHEFSQVNGAKVRLRYKEI